ncbi:hypothetical protein N784_02735 [Pontibacillus litoralis JSM 072002]|uniref:YhfH family protein n=1 Tax=Pontibacillus litoralis JSM 072002 TaxID=1385512 RepID=A0A0A5G4U1_9BACI|nr:hypothetical protein N784_02735 [Pontibacillus litoralis JSM 072002]
MNQAQKMMTTCPECGEQMDQMNQKFMMECERCLSKREE